MHVPCAGAAESLDTYIHISISIIIIIIAIAPRLRPRFVRRRRARWAMGPARLVSLMHDSCGVIGT